MPGETQLKQLLRVLLPEGGMTLMLSAYFDESGTHAGSAITCVAGYVFESDQIRRFEEEWRRQLDRFHLSVFHMADCAHGVGPFAAIRKEDRADLGQNLIGIIKRRARVGIVASTCEDVLARYRSDPALTGSSYVLCLLHCMAALAGWRQEMQETDRLAIFFESGHRLQERANQAMLWMQRNPILRDGINYGSHTFIGKSDAAPIQAADLLAWEWQADWRNRMGPKRRPRRASLVNLLGLPHRHSHLTEEHFRAIAARSGGILPEVHSDGGTK